MINTKTPPRLHVLIAKNAQIAVVIRRGPSKQVCSILWNLKTNKFQIGQWLKGRIYERRSDISPDGQYMIYFAMNGKWNSETKGSWTAISKIPYLKAITLYAKGDCWNGGGLFIDDQNYLLNEKYETHVLIHDESKLIGRRGIINNIKYANNECLGIYYPRLLRDGWELNENMSTVNIQVFDKKWKTFILRKLAHIGNNNKQSKGIYWDSHVLCQTDGPSLEFPNWEWADIVEGCLTWAESGKIYALHKKTDINKENFLGSAKILYDFNEMRFEERIAPY